MAKKKITDFQPQKRNSNKHTQRGMSTLEKSIEKDGWIGAITVAADGETFDGSARIEVGAMLADGVEPIIVESDGTRPVIHIRKDIQTATDPKAKRLGVAANRVAQLNLDYDVEELARLQIEDVDLTGLFTETEFDLLTDTGAATDQSGHWQGMPEFEQDDVSAPYSVKVNFNTLEDLQAFASLVGQNLTECTKFIYYPKLIQESYGSVIDES